VIDEMRIRGLGVIDDAVLPLGAGFTAVTGETGAGKTMVVTGLGLLLGARADSSAIRAGAAQASVAGVWMVPPQGPVADIVTDAGGELEPAGDAAELFVSRTLSAEGRSRASVGGRPAPAGVLASLAEELVVVHGQSDQLRLRSAAAQRDALDRFGGEAIATALASYREPLSRWRELDAEITELTENRDRRAAEAALLREQLAEIEQLDPQPGEDVELNERAERLANSEELRLSASVARSASSAPRRESSATVGASSATASRQRRQSARCCSYSARSAVDRAPSAYAASHVTYFSCSVFTASPLSPAVRAAAHAVRNAFSTSPFPRECLAPTRPPRRCGRRSTPRRRRRGVRRSARPARPG